MISPASRIKQSQAKTVLGARRLGTVAYSLGDQSLCGSWGGITVAKVG
jgi:hypothetical protein